MTNNHCITSQHSGNNIDKAIASVSVYHTYRQWQSIDSYFFHIKDLCEIQFSYFKKCIDKSWEQDTDMECY